MNEPPPKRFVGIDPGKSGALALICDRATWTFPFRDKTDLEIANIVDQIVSDYDHDGGVEFAVIEKVHAMPKQGLSSTFKFGMNYGFLTALLTVSPWSYEHVPPGVWQQKLGCLSKGDKNKTKAKAEELFPWATITHSVADALLLAEYARRTWTERNSTRKS